LRAFVVGLGNLRERGAAWWGSEDSNCQAIISIISHHGRPASAHSAITSQQLPSRSLSRPGQRAAGAGGSFATRCRRDHPGGAALHRNLGVNAGFGDNHAGEGVTDQYGRTLLHSEDALRCRNSFRQRRQRVLHERVSIYQVQTGVSLPGLTPVCISTDPSLQI
jgi:hypothetical protein